MIGVNDNFTCWTCSLKWLSLNFEEVWVRLEANCCRPIPRYNQMNQSEFKESATRTSLNDMNWFWVTSWFDEKIAGTILTRYKCFEDHSDSVCGDCFSRCWPTRGSMILTLSGSVWKEYRLWLPWVLVPGWADINLLQDSHPLLAFAP